VAASTRIHPGRAAGLLVFHLAALAAPWTFTRAGLLVNSVNHRWGYRNYPPSPDNSRNCWWVALLTFGEGWHNNHHQRPRCAAHGHRWFEVDATYGIIRLLERVGLAREVVHQPRPAPRASQPSPLASRNSSAQR
jgi:stearoyl-CoA desaturase (delta-9 desaturase)